MDVPFRWNVTKREQLGRLVEGPEAETYAGLEDDLRQCAARVLASSQDSDLVFIGRSPESLFDYLSGVLLETSWIERLSLFNLSLRAPTRSELSAGVVRRHAAALHLSPREIASRPRPIALVDLVWTGETLGGVAEALIEWARDEQFDPNAVRRRLRFVGITWRKKTSPNTFRWQQHAEWLADFRSSAVKNVSIPGRLWTYLGNEQPKAARTQPQYLWEDEAWRYEPPREDAHLQALRLALRLFDHGRSDEERERLAACIAQEQTMTKPWLRALVTELRRA